MPFERKSNFPKKTHTKETADNHLHPSSSLAYRLRTRSISYTPTANMANANPGFNDDPMAGMAHSEAHYFNRSALDHK